LKEHILCVYLMAQGIALEKLSTHLWVVIQKNKNGGF
jgi:hypothetical protein